MSGKNESTEYLISVLMNAAASEYSPYEYLICQPREVVEDLRNILGCNMLEMFLFFRYAVYRQRQRSQADGPESVDWDFVNSIVGD